MLQIFQILPKILPKLPSVAIQFNDAINLKIDEQPKALWLCFVVQCVYSSIVEVMTSVFDWISMFLLIILWRVVTVSATINTCKILNTLFLWRQRDFFFIQQQEIRMLANNIPSCPTPPTHYLVPNSDTDLFNIHSTHCHGNSCLNAGSTSPHGSHARPTGGDVALVPSSGVEAELPELRKPLDATIESVSIDKTPIKNFQENKIE